MEMVVLNYQWLFHVKQIKNNYPGMVYTSIDYNI